MLLAEFILCLGRWHIGPGPGSQTEWCHGGSRVGPRQSETVVFKIFVYFMLHELHRSIDLRVVRRCQSTVASLWTSSCGRRVFVLDSSIDLRVVRKCQVSVATLWTVLRPEGCHGHD